MSLKWSLWDDPLRLTGEQKVDYASHVRAWRFDRRFWPDIGYMPANDGGRERWMMERYWRLGPLNNAKRHARAGQDHGGRHDAHARQAGQ